MNCEELLLRVGIFLWTYEDMAMVQKTIQAGLHHWPWGSCSFCARNLDHANLVFISLSGSMQWGGDKYTPKSWCLQESSNSGTIWNLRVMEGSTSNEDGGGCTAITDATFCSWDRCLHWQKAIFSHGICIELLVISEELHKWYEV
jgi:hypothetical protein